MSDPVDINLQDLDEIFQTLDKEEKMDSAQRETNLKEAKEIIEQLQLSLPSIRDQKKKNDVEMKIKGYKNKIDKTRKASLLSGVTPSSSSKASAEEKQQKSLEILESSRKQIVDIEEIGNGVLSTLDQQTETIKRSHSNLKDTHRDLKDSDKLLNRMSKWWRG